MNARTPLTLLFAVCCVFAGVSMAASLESSVSGKPDDIIDVDLDALPLPAQQAEQVADALDADSDRAGQGGSRSVQSDDGDGETGSNDADNSDSSSERSSTGGQAGGSSDGTGASAAASGQGSGEAAAGGQSAQSDGGQDSSASGETPVERSRLLLLLAILAVGVSLAMVIYKREALLARLRRARQSGAGTDTGPAAVAREPSNAVERQWLELLERIEGVDNPTLTPRERAAALVEAGEHREAVQSMRELVESVRYDDTAVTAKVVSEASGYLKGAGGDDDD